MSTSFVISMLMIALFFLLVCTGASYLNHKHRPGRRQDH